MRRMRHYDYEQEDNNESNYGEAPTLPYFLHDKHNTNFSNKYHNYHRTENYSPSSGRIPMQGNTTESEEDEPYYATRDTRYPYSKSESDRDEVEVYSVVSDGFLTSRYNHNRALVLRVTEQMRREKEQMNASQHQPLKKKVLCKFCETSKQPGSCPCPIHLPTVQSRYMRVLQDNSRNAITINVFRNGDYRVTPTMIHIPKFHMRSMEEIMKIVDKFVRFPVGYAYALYTVLGDLVEDPRELEPYEMYVVVNNCKKQFVPLEYGSKQPSNINSNRRRRTNAQSTFSINPFNIRG